MVISSVWCFVFYNLSKTVCDRQLGKLGKFWEEKNIIADHFLIYT